MEDPNGNEALPSSTAIGKIYSVSFILFLSRFAVIAFQIWISFQICPSLSNWSFWKIFKQILKLLKWTQTIALYLFICVYWFEIIWRGTTRHIVSSVGTFFLFYLISRLYSNSNWACIFFNRAGWLHFQCNSMPRTCRRGRLVWTEFFQEKKYTGKNIYPSNHTQILSWSYHYSKNFVASCLTPFHLPF